MNQTKVSARVADPTSNQITINESLRRKYRAVETMAKKIAHETNNYYGIIQGYISLIELQLKDEKKLLEMLDPMKEALRSGINLNKRLASFYRTTDVMGADTDLVAALTDVCATFSRDQEFVIELLAEDMLQPLYLDEPSLRHLAGDLCLLAKATGTEPARLELASRQLDEAAIASMVLAGSPGNYVRLQTSISLTDYPQEEETEFLNPFVFDTGEPSGLGLALLYGTLKNHGGNLDVTLDGDSLTLALYFPAKRT